jgi:hypothetical protein
MQLLSPSEGLESFWLGLFRMMFLSSLAERAVVRRGQQQHPVALFRNWQFLRSVRITNWPGGTFLGIALTLGT